MPRPIYFQCSCRKIFLSNPMYHYPQKAAFNCVIAKRKIYQHARPTRRVQQLFVDQISRIVWQYKLAPETTNLAARPSVPEIQVFQIILKADELDKSVLRCIDKAISFPIVYEIIDENRIKEMAAYKRPSEADATKWVVGDYFETAWQATDTPRTPLPLALDLQGLYEQLLRRLMPYPVRPGETMPAQAARMSAIRGKESECRKLETRLRQEMQFNRKVEMNRQLRDLKNELDGLLG